MDNPYTSLSPAAFWKTGVAQHNPLEITNLWTSKLQISTADLVTTAGSCFAQHISRAMLERGFSWLDSEPLPDHLPKGFGRSHGYGVFSFRTGNIYTTSLLRQWVDAAFGVRPLETEVWEKDGRYFDPMRPAIEPGGFNSAEECLMLRQQTLNAIKTTLSETTLFVFTLGLTESWINSSTGMTYAACPGTLAGEFSPDAHKFVNLTYPEIIRDLSSALDTIRRHNPQVKFLLTVSPVPLTATASEIHVLPATVYSKSVLRAVAGDVAASSDDVDYFPSYEIISSFPYRGGFYEPNMREVSRAGVDHVMQHFFAGISKDAAAKDTPIARKPETPAKASQSPRDEDAFAVECEEALLEAFSK